MRYADPSLCPDCRSPLPPAVGVCPTCHLLVRHDLAVQLFGTLQAADALVVRLRALSDQARANRPLVPVGAAPPPPAAAVRPAAAPLPSYPGRPGAPQSIAPGPGVASASVPKILLGLGALCLLVAALVFLAVSWSALGVGGRTAVLGGLTVAAGAAALLLHRAGLRIAGESLVVVALGMLGLDVVGAGAAGWFGESPGGVVAVVAGLALAATGAGLGVLRVGGMPRLVAPQVVSGIGLFVAYAGAMDVTDHRLLAGHAVTVVGVLAVLAARSVRMAPLMWSHLAAAAVVWLGTAALALVDALGEPDLEHLWIDGAGWSLLATAAAMLLPGAVRRARADLLVGASAAALVVTAVTTLPTIDTDAETVGLVALAVTAAWLLALALLPRTVRAVAVAPSVAGSVILSGLALVTAGVALSRWAEVGTAFGRPADVVLRHPDPVTEPLLLVPSLIAVVALLALLTPDRGRAALTTWLGAGAVVAGLGVTVTLASYDVALALPVAVLGLVALAGAGLAVRSTGARALGFGTTSVAVAAAACLAALPSSTLTAAVALVAFLAALGLAVTGGDRGLRVVSGVATAPFLALAVGAFVDVTGAGASWVAIPVLLGVGVLAVALARPEVEVGAAASAVLALPVSLIAAADAGGFTALWLTVAGCLACATALVHESRRPVAWAGGVLLLLASWVRLADLDVRQPEAYTLPLAAALLGLGLWRLRRDPRAGTAETLLPGLLIATVPSLLWVLDDPVSVRALLLGATCLALAIGGAALRWSAPLLVGAAVGAIVVLLEIGPYAGEFPKWVWIGLAGALLTVVGITWERRLLEVRQAVGYLGNLR